VYGPLLAEVSPWFAAQPGHQEVAVLAVCTLPPSSSVCFLTTNSKIDIQQFLDANRASLKAPMYGPLLAEVGPWFQVPSSESTVLYCTVFDALQVLFQDCGCRSEGPLSVPAHVCDQITVDDPSHTSCLEQHVPQWIWRVRTLAWALLPAFSLDGITRVLSPALALQMGLWCS